MRASKRQKIILLLFGIFAFLGVGFAYLTTDLSILGTALINGSKWDVHWENVQEVGGTVEATSGPTIDVAGTTVSFGVTLSKPGDYYTFLVDAKNAGTIDAMVNEFKYYINGSEVSESNPLPKYLFYSVSYYDGVDTSQGDLLKAGDYETVLIEIGYRTDIDPSDIPEEDQIITASLKLNYRQATSSAKPAKTYAYRANENEAPRNALVQPGEYYCDVYGDYTYECFETKMECDEAIADLPDDQCELKEVDYLGTTYSTDQETVTETQKPVFLKHTIVNNRVVDSQIGFIQNNKIQYLLAGNSKYVSSMSNIYLSDFKKAASTKGAMQISNHYDIYYDLNKTTLNNIFGSGNCTETTNRHTSATGYFTYHCQKDDMEATVTTGGYFAFGIDNWGCYIDNMGSSCNVGGS